MTVDNARLHVFDLDGVLLDSSHRIKLVECSTSKKLKLDLNHWKANCDKAHLDKVIKPNAERYKQIINDPEKIGIIATARGMVEHDYTLLFEQIGKPDYLIHRHIDDDVSKDYDLKIRGIYDYLKTLLGAKFKEETLLKWTKYNMIMHEDNIENLQEICKFFQCRGVFYPSKQWG